ncbi:UDP-Glycosyltransferase superfamily protein [Striga asiatica]|uniref:UDP-Glycosyltransferase superfamily protein n=1 Tax=Striga asiatica TaxID=4170 RepID=A0A5A7PUG2_STRAF|nr:UDP-Glycosyltransferase superfamily protein [Striga asiatica]
MTREARASILMTDRRRHDGAVPWGHTVGVDSQPAQKGHKEELGWFSHSKLEIAVQEAVTKEAAARQDTELGRLLEVYRKELLALYHDSMPFLAVSVHWCYPSSRTSPGYSGDPEPSRSGWLIRGL